MTSWHALLTVFPFAVGLGILIAGVCAVLGVFVILKRTVFISAVLSEVSAAGLALALVLNLPPLMGAAVFTLAAGYLLSRPFETARVPRDAVLGAIFVTAAAASILLAARTGLGLEEVKGLLYGDLILAGRADLWAVLGSAGPVMLVLGFARRPIFYTFLDREAAFLLGIRVRWWDAVFFLSLSAVIALASRAAGALLIFAYLVLPSSAALLLSRRLSVVFLLAVGFAVGATLLGLHGSLAWDLPTNQLVVALLALPTLMAGMARAIRRWP